jgi:hypothetical protein
MTPFVCVFRLWSCPLVQSLYIRFLVVVVIRWHFPFSPLTPAPACLQNLQGNSRAIDSHCMILHGEFPIRLLTCLIRQ